MEVMEKPFISIIIPAYNEADRLPTTLAVITAYLRQKPFCSEIVVIDDGSQDETFNIAADFFYKTHWSNLFYQILKNPQNLGKGASIRFGISKANGDFILFTDADNSTPIEELDKLLPFLITPQQLVNNRQSPTYEIAIGSRHLKESSILIHQPWYRKLLGRFANLLIQLLLLPGISDTQCGFKLFKADVAKELFAKSRLNRWGFDMEILFLAREKNYRIKEVPVLWLNSPNSRLRPIKDGLKTLKELLQIKFNNWRGQYF